MEKKTNNMIKINNENYKKKNFTVHERINILKRLKEGERQVDLARELMVKKSTIATIHRRRESILRSEKALQICNSDTRKKRFRGTESSPAEVELYKWFTMQRDAGLPVSGIHVQKKALQLNKKYGCSERFRATTGWLNRFKERWGIRCLSVQRGKKLADNIAHESNKIEESNNQDDISIEKALKGLNEFIKFYEKREDCSFSVLQIFESISQDMVNEILIKTKI